MESSVFSPEDEAVIQNHLYEIAALPEDRFTQLKSDVVNLGNIVVDLGMFFHPDRPGHACDLGYQLASKTSLAIEIVRRASEIREKRKTESQNG